MNFRTPTTLAIALGANLPSQAGPPIATLKTVKPMIEKLIYEWIQSFVEPKKKISSIESNLQFNWSPLYQTNPIGGPENQPLYINAGLIIRGNALSDLTPSPLAAENLLERFLKIEKKFGRDRDISKIRWSARSLDIDLIAWSDLQIKNAKLILPHPRFIERDFVIIPLAAAMQKNSVGVKQIPEQKDWC